MINKILKIGNRFVKDCNEKYLSASAANAAYFIMLSFIPCTILLTTLVQYTGLERMDLIRFFQRIVPSSAMVLVSSIINQAYKQTTATISMSAVMALISAGQGMMALTQGLQLIYGVKEKRGFIVARIRATIYTVLLLVFVILYLFVGVFGTSISSYIVKKFPIASYAVGIFRSFKTIGLTLFSGVVFALIYRFVVKSSLKFHHHIPGAVLASAAWYCVSSILSWYVVEFQGFSNMYGSLTTIVLLMLWLYFGMYIILLGAEINSLLFQK